MRANLPERSKSDSSDFVRTDADLTQSDKACKWGRVLVYDDPEPSEEFDRFPTGLVFPDDDLRRDIEAVRQMQQREQSD